MILKKGGHWAFDETPQLARGRDGYRGLALEGLSLVERIERLDR
jgi:hypothetical protein